MKLFATAILIWSLVYHAKAFSISNIFGSGKDIVEGIGKEIINVIPTPGELFKVLEQILIGLPEEAVFKTVNQLCSLYMASDTIDPLDTPDIDKMYLQLRTPCKNIRFPLTNPEEILDSPDFDVEKKVVIFITGWLTNVETDAIADMAKAYHCRGGYNYFALDSADFIDTFYTWSAVNTEEIGKMLAKGLQTLVEGGVKPADIHLIGHSLGAHIVGYAGRYFNNFTHLNISRITGLDPANPCFNAGETLSGLQRGDADFIDVIHTNPGVLGKRDPLGDVDFYAGGLAPIKPGCLIFSCSHLRAYAFYTETVYPGNKADFLGVSCTSLTKLNDGLCVGRKLPMGFSVPYDLKGIYFLAVNAEPPYGQDASGEGTLASSDCGLCKSE